MRAAATRTLPLELREEMGLLKELALADLDQELAATRRVIARIPDEKLSWRPHEKSTPLGALGAHLASIVGWIAPILTTDGIDFAGSPPPAAEASSSASLLAYHDASVAALRPALAEADESTFGDDWTLRVGSHVIFTRPRLVVLRSFALSHAAHHRGQLTVYLRLLDVPVPPVYGPTADEQ